MGAQDLCDADFFYMIADSAAMAVQYGHKDKVCDHMIKADEAGVSLTEVQSIALRISLILFDSRLARVLFFFFF